MAGAKNFNFEVFTYREHAQLRMFQRNISAEEIEQTIEYGEKIEDYPTDTPFPSCLMFKVINDRPIHVVLGINGNEGFIISLYEPSIDKFEKDFKTRKPKK